MHPLPSANAESSSMSAGLSDPRSQSSHVSGITHHTNTIRTRCALALHRLVALALGRRKSASTTFPPPSFPTHHGSLIPTGSSSKGPLTTGKHGCRRIVKKFEKITNGPRRQVVSIDVLPDDVLLVVFDFSVDGYPERKREIEAWQALVHVCRRWRSVVFGSPNRLNLELVCSAKTPARDTLDVWPALPLRIRDDHVLKGVDNIVAVLERSDRVRVVNLWDVSNSDLEILSAAMQVPFPVLTDLWLKSYGEVVLPDSFLGGSAPRLQFLSLSGIPFPGLPNLLLSVTHLVSLYLRNIPHSGYISPEAMATALSTLTRLDELVLGFKYHHSRPDWESRHPPPATRSVLSALTSFWFKGDSEYLDTLVAHIDAPRLNELRITFFNDIIFDTPQLLQFICLTPTLKPLECAHVIFNDDAAKVSLSSRTSVDDLLYVMISCRELDWQLSSVGQVCTSSLPPLSALEYLYIYEGHLSSREHWQDNIENAQWLELLHPFRAAKNLYLTKEFARRIGPALQELVGSRATEVLPTLQNIFLEGLQPSGSVQEGIQQFVATRQVTGDPIAISPWDGL